MTAKLARSQRTGAQEGAAVHKQGRSLLKVGDLLAGKYRVERVLGEGGMGVVVEAYHELLDQRVAVKLLYQDIADREAQSRLLMEARSAAKLQSEHVARVVDVDVGPDGLPFIVMELLEGADLCQLADAQGALPVWVVADYMLQACEGLAHAHGRGIVHRDLKPSNLFLATRPDGQQIIKILDFGISKSQGDVEDRRQKLTGGGTVLGSPPYMSPEQIRAPKTIDHRTDIWALGICMYELLTNSMPFGGEAIQEAFAQILERQPTPIRALVPTVPEGFEMIVMTCLAKNRNERFSDVSELAKALAPYGSGVWNGMGERVQAVLARALMEEVTSGTRLRGNVVTPDAIAIPSSPGRRLDSGNAELNGTSATVQRRRGSFWESKRSMTLVAAAAAGLGVVLITGGVVLTRRPPPPSDTDPGGPAVAPIAEPSPASTAAAAATGAVITGTSIPAPPATTVFVAPAGTDVDPSLAPQSLLGASPTQAQPAGANVRTAPRPVAAPAARPPTPAPATKKPAAPAPSSGSKGLPSDLPLTRDGK